MDIDALLREIQEADERLKELKLRYADQILKQASLTQATESSVVFDEDQPAYLKDYLVAALKTFPRGAKLGAVANKAMKLGWTTTSANPPTVVGHELRRMRDELGMVEHTNGLYKLKN